MICFPKNRRIYIYRSRTGDAQLLLVSYAFLLSRTLKSVAFQFSSDCEREYVFEKKSPNTGTFVQVLTISSNVYDFSGDLVHGKLMEWFFVY